MLHFLSVGVTGLLGLYQKIFLSILLSQSSLLKIINSFFLKIRLLMYIESKLSYMYLLCLGEVDIYIYIFTKEMEIFFSSSEILGILILGHYKSVTFDKRILAAYNQCKYFQPLFLNSCLLNY